MTDHDQRLKTLLKIYLAKFFEAFLPEWRHRFDFDRVEWLENEVFPDPPEGQRQVLDLVARLPLIDAEGIDVGDVAEAFVALIHVEIESGTSIVKFRRRHFRYHASLRQKYELPVLPIAVFLKVGLDGLGIDVYRETCGPLETICFRYCYVGFPTLKAVEYLERNNELALGLMGLMDVPEDERVRLRAEAMRRIHDLVEDEFRQFLLTECLETYWTLNDEEQQQFEALLDEPEYEEIETMAVTTFEKGIEKGIERGIERGRELGRRETALEIACLQLDHVPPEVLARIERFPLARMTELMRFLVRCDSVENLVAFLDQSSEEPGSQDVP